MSQLIDSKRKKEIESASHNLDAIMRRIGPFIRRPKEEPKERQNWVNAGSNVQVRPGNKKTEENQ
ncbi:MAG: hypothetical protein U5P41_14445 [Gammaproteobacteria bacterium]|nr:hypothetical protein [Gammaproteobacteria bacterium]